MVNKAAPPTQTIAICFMLIRPINNTRILTPKSINAVDKFAKPIRINTKQTEPIMGIKAFLTSFMFSCFLVNVRAKKVIKASFAKSDV